MVIRCARRRARHSTQVPLHRPPAARSCSRSRPDVDGQCSRCRLRAGRRLVAHVVSVESDRLSIFGVVANRTQAAVEAVLLMLFGTVHGQRRLRVSYGCAAAVKCVAVACSRAVRTAVPLDCSATLSARAVRTIE